MLRAVTTPISNEKTWETECCGRFEKDSRAHKPGQGARAEKSAKRLL
jgi:hypothetical protein